MTTLLRVHGLTQTGEIEPRAYVWFSPLASLGEPIVELHLCAKPQARGRWLTRPVLRSLYTALENTGARWCVALVPDATLRRYLTRLGWETRGDFVNVLDMENTHGISHESLRGRGR